MYRAKKPLLSDLNEHLICKLCKGYFVDATTIVECLHTFCRSCIVKYLETTKYCPVCDVQVHKSKPLLSLRPDRIIQDIVYKLVPRLYQNELRRRKEYIKKHSDIKLSALEESFESSHGLFLTPEEELSVTLTYYGSLGKPRYLRCPSAVSVMVLQKLIRAKFGLSDSHHVDILHNQDCLNPSYTLMDVLYIYKLSKLESLDLTYRIYEYMAKKMRLDSKESESKEKIDISLQPTLPNNNNWKEVQLRISENGEMSITGIQDNLTSQSFSKEMIEVLDTKPKSPIMNTTINSIKKKELPELKFIRKPPNSKCINILSETIIRPYSVETRLNECLLTNPGKKESITTSSITVPSINSTTTTVFTTVNSTKCSVGSSENLENHSSEEKVEKEFVKERGNDEEVRQVKEKSIDKGIKRKFDHENEHSNNEINTNTKKIDSKTLSSNMNDDKNTIVQTVEVKLKTDFNELGRQSEGLNNEEKIPVDKYEITEQSTKKHNCAETDEKLKVISDVSHNEIQKSNLSHRENRSNCTSNHVLKEVKDVDAKTSTNKNWTSPNPLPPKPSTKYQGASQPCYMPKTSFNPVLNIPKLLQSTVKNEMKTSSKSTSNIKNEIRISSSLSSSPVYSSTSNSSSITKQKLSTKVKSNAPIGYKTLKDPPKSWNSQISKANLNKPQPDPKYSDLKNVRPPKFFKMRNNMLRFLGNPASGVKPMYSVHPSSEQDKPQEKVVENREIKKHSIVKIDPKTLKPISEKAPETTSLSSQVSTTTDLKINTSSVSIFNPLKLQSNSPKSERKSPKSPQSPRHKSSPSPSPPVHKRDLKPNLNFTPPNPFIPNLSSQTINPNQFLCNPGPPGFPTYDPRVVAAYNNLFYGSAMGFSPNPLSYHLGGLDITQRGKGFDISKIVGMQQQASSSKSPSSPQGTSKLEVPIVPPQVPYQPRPNPMSSRTSNVTSTTKRTQKDNSKNEKSLQNTVEKLTLSRAKEIHKAALSKLISSDAINIESSKDNKGDKKLGNNKGKDDEAQGTQPVNCNALKENWNETKTSQKEVKLEMRKKDNLISACEINNKKHLKDNSKSENRDNSSEKNDTESENELNISEKPVGALKPDEEDRLCRKRTDLKSIIIDDDSLKKKKVEKDDVNSVVISDQQNSVHRSDNIFGKSDDSKKLESNINEAGSEKLDEVAGSK